MVLKLPAGSRFSRRTWIAGAAASAALASVRVNVGAQNRKQIIVAEPVHQIGYLPLYMAIDLGLFAKRGLDVSTLTATGGAHVSALVSGSVWANIGGPESDAMANGNGNVKQLGTAVFTIYLFALEATSALLVIAVVGAVLLARRERATLKDDGTLAVSEDADEEVQS